MNHRSVTCRWLATILAVGAAQALAADAGAAGGFPGRDATTQSAVPGPVRLILPEAIYASPGVETNVYFDNVVLVLNPANYAFDVTCAKGTHQAERWTYTPAPGDVGEYPFLLDVRDQANRVIARAHATVRVVAPDAQAGKAISALLIGDSLTHHSVYAGRLLDLCRRPGNPKLTLVGSHHPPEAGPDVRHEGYGGWTAAAATRQGSPFVFEEQGRRQLDFGRYCRNLNGGKSPDYVTIFLGCNDTYRCTDEDIEGTIDEMLVHMDALIDMVRRVSKETRIGLIVPVPPAGTQDAFGANDPCGQTRWQYKRNQHRVVERMAHRYGRRKGEGISIVPAYVNLDCLHNYPQSVAAWNAETAATTARLNNAVHPSPEGYRQIGDSVYCWMLAH